MRPEQLGPYRIVRTLGRGGMGAVYEGINQDTDESAAIKILSAALATEPDFRQRFEAEIETLRKLYHPNIVQLFGFGEQDGYLFYAMELVNGNSLEEELRRGRVFDWREVVRIGIETCRALRHAHDRGIIHRDIKPANLLLSTEGRVKLSDFGIARLFGNTRITVVGSVLGTAEYMAPEQAEGRPVGPKSDLYSLGALLYCLLARQPPFRARSLPEMLEKHRSALPDPVRRYAPDTPAELDHIVLQLLEKDPEKRIANATLVSRRLYAMLQALTIEPSTEEERLLGELADQLNAPPPEVQSAPSSKGGLPETQLATDQAEVEPQGAGPDVDSQAADRLPKVPSGRTMTHVVDGDAGSRIGGTAGQMAGGGAESAARPPRAAGELPATKATEAFQVYAGAQDPSTPAPQSATLRLERPGSGRFFAVGQEDLDPVEASEPAHAALISIHTWILAGALLGVGLTVWYLLRPPTADALYRRIGAMTEDKSIDSLIAAESHIEEFLKRFSDDSRCPQLQKYVREIELHRLKQTFERRAKGLTKSEALLPIEQAYLEAINYATLDPQRGLVRLQALVDLYQDRTELSGPAGRCLELARRRCQQLRQQIEQAAADCRVELEGRLQRAEDLYATNPAAARSMWQGLIEFYQDKPWAADAVAKARAKLAPNPGYRPPIH